jgi:alpha-L-rhamnosidase
MRAIALKTEYMVDPVGIDGRQPRLSWLCEDGLRQTAYEIRTCCRETEPRCSGRVESGDMFAFYTAPLNSRTRVVWQVRLWDENGVSGPWSDAAFFETGPAPEDYAAKWIDPEIDHDPEIHKPASYLRKTFFLSECPASARLYITAHGLYEASINGRRAGDFVLAPGTSSYDKRLHVQTYDVTALLRSGENEVLVILGDGW